MLSAGGAVIIQRGILAGWQRPSRVAAWPLPCPGELRPAGHLPRAPVGICFSFRLRGPADTASPPRCPAAPLLPSLPAAPESLPATRSIQSTTVCSSALRCRACSRASSAVGCPGPRCRCRARCAASPGSSHSLCSWGVPASRLLAARRDRARSSPPRTAGTGEVLTTLANAEARLMPALPRIASRQQDSNRQMFTGSGRWSGQVVVKPGATPSGNQSLHETQHARCNTRAAAGSHALPMQQPSFLAPCSSEV